MRAPAVPLALAFVAGIHLWPANDVILCLLGAGLAVVVSASGVKRKRFGVATAAVFVSFVLLGSAAMVLRSRPADNSLTTIYDALGAGAFETPWRVIGRTRDARIAREHSAVLVVDVERIERGGDIHTVKGGLRVSVRGAFLHRLDEVEAGTRIAVWARLREPAFFANPGGFDGDAYLRQNAIELVASTKSALLVSRVNPPRMRFRSLMARMRERATERLRVALTSPSPGDAAFGIVTALVTGDRTHISKSHERAFRRAGIFHVMSISGAHVALVLVGLHGLLRRAGMDERPSLVVMLLLLPVYAEFTGSRAAVWRAAVMAAVVLGARLSSLDRASVNTLAVAALALLCADPSTLYDPGFQLSFGAMIGILLGFRPLEEMLQPLGWMCRPIALSIAAQLGVLPVAAVHFRQLTPIAPWTSVVALPVAALLVALGLLAVVTATIPIVSTILVGVLRLGVWILVGVAELGASVPVASLRVGAPSVWWVGLYFIGLVFLSLRRPGARWLGLAWMACLVLQSFLPSPSSPHALELTMLDVGHGDAIVAELPDGKAVLIDGGGLPRSSLDTGESVVLPFLLDRGIRRLDAVIVTHADYDHIGGLATIVDELDVGAIWEGAPAWDRPAYRELRTVAHRRGVDVRRMAPGERFTFGGIVWNVVAAAGARTAMIPETENDRSVVLRLSYGMRHVLLTGDAEATLESAILESKRELRSDVLKVAHHGSRDATSAAFLDAVQPRFAVISGRRHSTRPLPSDEVLRRLRDRDITIARTDVGGAVSIRIARDGDVRLTTFLD